VATGIVYFILAGKFILPEKKSEVGEQTSTMEYFSKVYGIKYAMYEIEVPNGSNLIGQNLNDFEQSSRVRVIAMSRPGEDSRIGPGSIDRGLGIEAGTILGVLTSATHLKNFVIENDLKLHADIETFTEALSAAKAGIAEIVIPPGSSLVGKSARDVWLRKRYGLSMVALHRGGETYREGDGIRDMPFQPGDTLICHTSWDTLSQLKKNRDFVVITTEYPHEELRPNKVTHALFFFTVALFRVLITDLRLSVALYAGAMGMILSGVLNIEEAYKAVSWKTVFLLASLIPLGLAVETTGTAKWIAEQVLLVVGHMPVWVIQAAVAILATFFTLVMSNVGATVLLVPLAVNIAIGANADPAVFALTVAIATSNSFLIPTHQVNALIMGPGGYRVPDFMRAGGVMTLLFLVVMMIMMNLVY